MLTQNRVLIYATETQKVESNYWTIYGFGFDGDFGFGDEDSQNYSGKAYAVFERERVPLGDVFIGIEHNKYRGMNWGIETQNLPDAPFLLTNSLLLKCVYKGTILPEKDNHSRQRIFPVYSSDSIGVVFKSNGSQTISIYSEKEYELIGLDFFDEFGNPFVFKVLS